jgi:cytochrome c biogenesis protein CcdA/glutaredoxin
MLKKIFSFIIFFLFLFLPLSLYAEDKTPITYYYGETCPHCKKVDAFFQSQKFYEKYNVVKKEISQIPENAKEYNETMTALNVPLAEQGVPTVVIGKGYLIGDEPIIDNFEKFAKIYSQNETLPEGDLEKANSDKNNSSRSSALTIGVILGAALTDSINPCAFAVLIFLVSYLLSVGSKKKAFKIGLAYILIVFLTYLAAGFGIFKTITAFDIAGYIRIIGGIFVILLALVSIKDFFWYGKGFSLSIPESKKPLIEKYVKKASLPAALILGFLASLFELPCTGGVYLAILALLSEKSTQLEAFFYLVIYNFIFILPLVIILFTVHFGYSSDIIEKWRDKNKKWMRLSLGLVMLALGILMLLKII